MPEFAVIDRADVPPERHTNGGHVWTDADRDLVRQWYRKVPTEKLAQHIGVTVKSVQTAACYQGLTRHQRAKSKHQWTEAEDDVLRAEYQQTHTSRNLLAHKLGLTPMQVAHRCSVLGLCKVTQRDQWTPEEDARLERMHEQGRTLKEIAKILKRSPNSVRIRANRYRRLTFRERHGWYTKREVCEILGVDHKWVQARIDAGTLRARPHFPGDIPQKNGQHPWHIAEADLKQFLRRHAHELNGRNVDLTAMVDILAGIEAAHEQ